jgi:copper chaperone CopZ
MKSIVAALCLAAFTFAVVGCNQSTAPTSEAVETTPPPPAGVQLVKLKLPGMVCGGCAMEVKDTLVKVEGVSHVATDPAKHECTFWFANSNDEIKAKLDDLAKTSDKIAGWERLN